jgi:small-conductance mechanosensitive channel
LIRGLAAALALTAAGFAAPTYGETPNGAAPAPAASPPAQAPAATPAAVAPAHAPAAAPAAAPAPTPAPKAALAKAASPAAVNVAADNQILAKLAFNLPRATNDAPLAAMDQQAGAIETAARTALTESEANSAAAAAALRHIPAHRHLTEAEETRRDALLASEQAAAAQAAQMQVLVNRAGQIYGQIAERRREGFSGRVLERAASPLSPTFWTSLALALDGDSARLGWLIRGMAEVAERALEPRGVAGVLGGILAAIVIVWPVRRFLEDLVWKRAHSLGSRGAARTVAIVWRVAIDVGALTLAANAIRLGAQWGGLVASVGDQLAAAAVVSVAWASTVIALGNGLSTAQEPEHRLLPIAESQAARARVSLWVVALITAAGFFLQRLNLLAGASIEATIAADCVTSIAYAAAAFLVLASFGRSEGGQEGDAARAPAWTLASIVLAVAIIATVGAVLLGYATLAALISGQIFWLSVIAAVTYLALRLVDDVLGALFSDQGRLTLAMRQLFGLSPSAVLQVGLLISAALQVLIILAAVMMALTPFGENGQLFMSHLRLFGRDLRVGKATISPIGLAGGVLTFLVGVGISHMARRWVVQRYLPVTNWDAGVRNSVATGVAYIGVGIALISALAVTGVGVAQIALVASALSVGIGFGLQQIVQNFVAGVILLIERPVKVGDWVSIGGVEGDVQAFRVRATDIRGLDGSTVIVPNSSLITTNVVNKTLGAAGTRIQLQVSVTKPDDIRRARETIFQLAACRRDVLKAPGPEVFVDALTAGGGANLDAWLYIADPRAAVRVKSELYLALVDAFGRAGIAM